MMCTVYSYSSRCCLLISPQYTTILKILLFLGLRDPFLGSTMLNPLNPYEIYHSTTPARIRSSAWHGPGTLARAANARNHGPATACCATSIRGQAVDGCEIHQLIGGLSMFIPWFWMISTIRWCRILQPSYGWLNVAESIIVWWVNYNWDGEIETLDKYDCNHGDSTMMDPQLAWMNTSPNIGYLECPWCVLVWSTPWHTQLCCPIAAPGLINSPVDVNRVCYGLLWSMTVLFPWCSLPHQTVWNYNVD